MCFKYQSNILELEPIYIYIYSIAGNEITLDNIDFHCAGYGQNNKCCLILCSTEEIYRFEMTRRQVNNDTTFDSFYFNSYQSERVRKASFGLTTADFFLLC